MEPNQPRRTIWVNPDIFERAQPDFARDHIFTLASYNPLAPIHPGATSWMAIPIEVPHFQAFLETNREYVDGYLLRGITIFTATHGPLATDVYIRMDGLSIATFNQTARAVHNMATTIAIIFGEAGRRGYIGMTQAQRLTNIETVMVATGLPQHEAQLLRGFFATRSGMLAIGVPDPDLLGNLPLPEGVAPGILGQNKENVSPNVNRGRGNQE